MHKKEFRKEYKHTVATQLRGVKRSGHFGSDSLFIGDSWFAGVDAALAYTKKGCHFTGVVKTGHALFPKDTLADYTPSALGGYIVYQAAVNKKPIRLWAVGVRTGRHKINQLITTCGTTHEAGTRTYSGWDEHGHRKTTTRVRTEVDAQYSAGQPAADVFNKFRQARTGIAMEKSYRPKNFEGRCFQTGMGCLAVDAFLMARITPLSCKYKATDLMKYVKALSYQLLTNPWRTDEFKRTRCRPLSSYRSTPANGDLAADTFDRRPPHSTQVSFGTLKAPNGVKFKYQQKWCLICNSKTSFFCPDCGTSAPVCRSTLRPECGAAHCHKPECDNRSATPRSTGARRSRSRTPSPPESQRRVVQRTAAAADVAAGRNRRGRSPPSPPAPTTTASPPATPADAPTQRQLTDIDDSDSEDETFQLSPPSFVAPDNGIDSLL